MSNEAVGATLFLTGLATVFVPALVVILVCRHRKASPTQGVRTTTLDGEPATVLRQIRPVQIGAAMFSLTGVVCLVGGWTILERSSDQVFWAVFFAVLGMWLIASGCYVHLGRYDQSLWFTRDKVIQQSGAAKQAVRWVDVIDVIRLPAGPGLVTSVPPEFCRTGPRLLLGGRKGTTRLRDAAGNPTDEYVLAVDTTGLYPRTHEVAALLVWGQHPELRPEIGTEAAAERLLAPPPPDPTDAAAS